MDSIKEVVMSMCFTSSLLERVDSNYIIYRIRISVDCEMSQKYYYRHEIQIEKLYGE